MLLRAGTSVEGTATRVRRGARIWGERSGWETRGYATASGQRLSHRPAVEARDYLIGAWQTCRTVWHAAVTIPSLVDPAELTTALAAEWWNVVCLVHSRQQLTDSGISSSAAAVEHLDTQVLGRIADLHAAAESFRELDRTWGAEAAVASDIVREALLHAETIGTDRSVQSVAALADDIATALRGTSLARRSANE
ncbi:hypothetical protein ACFVYG_22515 [Streptomyces sp. NPDC058256]|uniref:hypothetical protein n=1 Tax=Streptomyces sp. NPDC058256 TaxID=3346408 RepID=UPI0036E3B28B